MVNRHERRRQKIVEKQNKARVVLFQKKLTDAIRRDFPYYIAHVNGCGKPAFYCTQMPDVFGVIHPDTVMYPNGDMPKPQEKAKCGSCSAELLAEDITYDAVRMTK